MAQILTISSVSLEYVLVPVGVKVGGVAVDPTADVVEMAFLADGMTPGPSDWKSASWEVTVGSGGAANTYAAKCLVGPNGGTITLAPGGYSVWVHLVDNPEQPTRLVGPLRVI